MHKISVIDTSQLMRSVVQGHHSKDMLVLHETESKDAPGIGDIMGVENYLQGKGYGIHGMNDGEGHKAWARGLGDAIFWQAGGVNERSCGIEQISFLPNLISNKVLTSEQAWKHWLARTAQLNATAQLIAAWHNVAPKTRPLKRSNGNEPGVCSHWDVSQHFPASAGHWDCKPHDKGGHYPINLVIHLAQGFAASGYCF
jgi:hypothetical protein